ncbi:MAG: RDD family protein [Propionibacteriales bacterium]|nr:RDD family protein [Propionibacteriales bacterium]
MESGPVEQDYPGQRRGLPESGHGSLAGWGRRFLALAIDWLLSLLAASTLLGNDVWTAQGTGQWAPLAVFALQVWILTTLLGGSAGQVVCRVTVRRTSGQPLDLLRALLRTLLICAVIPPVIYNRDRQGLHDLAVDSITLER